MVPAKRPREEARVGDDVDDDAARVIPEQQAAVAFAVAAAVGGATPSKSVRLNLTQGESAEKEEIKSLGAIVVAAESSNVVAGNHVVTPALVRLQPAATTTISDPPARRALFSTPTTTGVASSLGNKKTQQHVLISPTITPSRRAGDSSMLLASVPVAAKRKLIFGRLVTETAPVQENVRQVYGIIRKFTGGIGGNGSHGPIYGELTMGSMQKMVNLMKQHAGLCDTSRFIDVGSGIGKPNFHVAQDPGVEFSYGIEIEADRWLLGMSCLKQVLNVAASQQQQQQQEQQTATTGARAASSQNRLQHRMLFEHGDIRNAKTFDPFTHVYMFSIGFPPQLWVTLSEMWNHSTSPYLICFHSPKDVIKSYEFDVELVTQMSTSMHGSKEGHTGYIYRRTNKSAATSSATAHEGGEKQQGSNSNNHCDPLFAAAQEMVKCGLHAIKAEVDAKVEEKMNNRTKRRVPGKKATAT